MLQVCFFGDLITDNHRFSHGLKRYVKFSFFLFGPFELDSAAAAAAAAARAL
jgi:hypothetical protein